MCRANLLFSLFKASWSTDIADIVDQYYRYYSWSADIALQMLLKRLFLTSTSSKREKLGEFTFYNDVPQCRFAYGQIENNGIWISKYKPVALKRTLSMKSWI